MRGALDWSLRDCAAAAGVAVNSVLTIEKDGTVSPRTEQRIRAAFKARGVRAWAEKGGFNVHIRDAPPPVPTTVPEELRALPYVTARPRIDGTWKVLFEVPARLRPDAWPPTRPLPSTGLRRGDLADDDEVERIKTDAGRFFGQLERARASQAAQDRR